MSATCRYCLAAWGDIYDDDGCGHGEREGGVARQLAALVHGEPDDKQVGWFMEDAELVCEVVPDAEPTVSHYNARTMRFRVGAFHFRVDDEGSLIVVPPAAIHQQDTDRAAR